MEDAYYLGNSAAVIELGLRPVVELEPNINLEKDENDIWKIK